MIAAPVLCAHARAVCRNRGFIGCQVKAREEALRFFFFFLTLSCCQETSPLKAIERGMWRVMWREDHPTSTVSHRSHSIRHRDLACLVIPNVEDNAVYSMILAPAATSG